jgi:hypothetical protein
MEALTTGSRRTRPTSLYVFLTLIVVVVTVALGAWLAGQPGPVGLPIADGEVVREDRLVATTTAADSSVAGWLDDGTNAAMAAPMEAARLLDAQVGAASPIVASEAESRVDDARIVRTANLELEVQDMAAALLSARSAIQGLGGYVSGSDAYDQGESRWASVTYRVPVAHFGEAVDALRGEADRVVREATQSIEVTGQVMDLDARIANLRASEAALVEIMDRAGRIEDVLAVQVRLEEVRGQIEQLEAQRAHLADQAALSTLAVSWYTPVAAVAAAQEGWDLGSEVDAALAQTVDALQGLVGLGIWFAVVVLPLVILPLLALLLLIHTIRRHARRGHGDAGATI